MEPKQAGPVGGYERPHFQSSGQGEVLPTAPEGLSSVSPEKAGERSLESLPVAERQATPLPTVPVLPPPVVVAADDTSIAQPAGDDGVPLVANDDDLIEKEWVDKAKQIIASTRDDPHKREKAISELQRDYIRKRYGREIGEAEG